MERLRAIKAEKGGGPDHFGNMNPGDENVAQHQGCTATVILISKTHIYCANAGDSRTVLARAFG